MLDPILEFIFNRTPIFYLIQSLWRDEAFSYFMAKPDIIRVIMQTANDFNPPFYYLILHFWITIVGKSDEWLRFLSFLPFISSIYVAYLLAIKMFSKKFAIFVALFTFLNPMLVYYAFEMRMYSFYALFTFLSLYFFYTKNWKWYTISAVLGLYTQSFFLLVIISFLLCVLLLKPKNKKWGFIFLVLKPVFFYLPWIPVLIIQFFRSKDSWLFPVDFQLVKSVLGNIFTNYEGTPGHLWKYTAIFSLVIIFFILNAFRLKSKRKDALMLFIPIFFPLFLVLGYSIIKRPIYVNRYMIFVAVFEIMIILMGIWNIRKRFIRWTVSLMWIIFLVFFNIYIVPYHKKTDFRTTFLEINRLAKPFDYVYAKTPIGFLESAYYYKQTNRVFIYNPENITIPNYIGITSTFSDVSKTEFPNSPSRVFLVDDEANYELIINK